MPAAPPTPIIISAAAMSPMTPSAMFRTPRTRNMRVHLVTRDARSRRLPSRPRVTSTDILDIDVVFLRAGGEVVDFGFLGLVFGPPVLVGIVDSTDRTFLDWAFGTAVGVLEQDQPSKNRAKPIAQGRRPRSQRPDQGTSGQSDLRCRRGLAVQRRGRGSRSRQLRHQREGRRRRCPGCGGRNAGRLGRRRDLASRVTRWTHMSESSAS